jgi:hypothetical protein
MEKVEWRSIILAIILSSILLMFNYNILEFNIFYVIIPAIIICLFVLVEKITANYIDTSIEIKSWEMSRWWYTTWAELKKPIPVGIVFPLLLGFLSGGMIKMLTLLQFHATALPSKSSKRYGARRISGIMEWDDALIGFYGLLILLALAIISSFMYSSIFPFSELAKYSFYYVLWNLIPISSLAGSKLFYGSYPLYIFTLILTALTFFILIIRNVGLFGLLF